MKSNFELISQSASFNELCLFVLALFGKKSFQEESDQSEEILQRDFKDFVQIDF
jgi:hypothetical protein